MTEKQTFKDCTGIAVIRDEKLLLGLRQDGQGWGLAGGKRESHETLEECAKRELKEEFGIEAVCLELVGTVVSEAKVKGAVTLVEPSIFICREFLGEIKINKEEHASYRWVDLKEALELQHIFPPSEQAISLLKSPHLLRHY